MDKETKNKVKIKKSHKGIIIALSIIAFLLAVFVFIGISGLKYARQQVNDLKVQAYELKDELTEVFDCVKLKDTVGAEKAVSEMEKTGEEIRNTLDNRFWHLIYDNFDEYKADIDTVENLLDILDTATENVVNPFINQMKTYPLSDLKTGEGFNVDLILSYLDFVDELTPKIEALAEEISSVRFNSIDMDFTVYSEKLPSLLEKFDILKENEEFLRVILGNGDDKFYLVMAQNTSEIRASGGFPGSMGTITIKNGILSIGDFSSVVNFIPYYSPYDVGKTEEEHALFGDLYMWQDRDANYNPHFAKVASITKLSYENYTGGHVDGVIGMTPHVIQSILEVTGDVITLSDGTVVDGSNSTKIIERDLYIKYKSNIDYYTENEEIMDVLFSETTNGAFSSLKNSFSLENAGSFFDMFKKCFSDRTIMVWLENTDDQEVVKAYGASGNLNFDENNPVAGVFFGNGDASKLGMAIAIDYELSEPVLNNEGCNEYSVTVTFTNYFNEAGLYDLNDLTYIVGNYDGAILSYVHLFAPAGGTVSGFQTNYGNEVMTGYYENLQVGYWHDVLIYPDWPLIVTYKVTTAPGVTTPLKIVNTPTLQYAR